MKTSTHSLTLLTTVVIVQSASAIGPAGSNPNNPLPTWNPNPSLVQPTGDMHGPVSGLPIGSDLPGFTDPHGRIPQLPFHHLSTPVPPQMVPGTNFDLEADGQLSPASATNLLDIYRPGELKRLIHWPSTSLQTLMPGAVQADYLNNAARPFPKISPPSYGGYWMGFADPPPSNPDHAPQPSLNPQSTNSMQPAGHPAPTVPLAKQEETPTTAFEQITTEYHNPLLPAKITNYAEFQRRQNDRWQQLNFDQPGAANRFGPSWWQEHIQLRYPSGGNQNWWHPADWRTVTAWLPWKWKAPIYYNYGDNIYYYRDTVYYGEQPFATADQYVAQAQALALDRPEQHSAENDWLPLGVFAVVPDDQPTKFLQLAISKSGHLAGTWQDLASGSVQSIEGNVDGPTQRGAWTVDGEPRPLMEAGLANLTQATAPMLIHFADDTTEQWLLVRLNQPTPATKPPLPAGEG